jgi:hypothetical protein
MTLPSLMCIALTGMLMNFFKKQIKGETTTEIRNYFRDHFKSTFTSIVTTVISCFAYYATLSTGKPADILTVFALGYMCDSFFNRWDKPQP